MKLTTHQGASTLGGNCVELQTDSGSILLDAGIPVKDKDPVLSKEYFRNIAKRVKAIFISHPHPDHYEMLKFMNRDTPVYMSRGCKKIIGAAHKFSQTEYDPSDAKVLNDEEVEIAALKIKPIPVDHSGFDSRAFYVKNGKTSVLYSGDLRTHGRRKYLTEKMVQELAGKVDYLILEGTLLSRNYEGCSSEKEVQNILISEFKCIQDLVLIALSSQNVDRLISVFKACLSANRTLVIDPYTAYILKEIRSISKNIPQHYWNNLGILFASNTYTSEIKESILFEFSRSKVTKEMIKKYPDLYVLKTNRYVEDHVVKTDDLLSNTTLIYSLWSGYAERIWKTNDVSYIHCSGHAQIQGLKKIVQKIKPKFIIPIHTEDVDQYRSLWPDKTKVVNNKRRLMLEQTLRDRRSKR